MRGVASVAVLLMSVGLPAAAQQPVGVAPKYTTRTLTDVPNAAAMTRRLWVPGLDDGYVPQGLTFADGAVYIGTYRSTDPAQSRGPCRLYRLDATSGMVTGSLDLSASCGHAGGMARGPGRTIWVADTRVIFEIALGAAGDSGIGKVLREIRLTGAVKGSFAAGGSDSIWLGTYAKEPGARLYQFTFAAIGSKATLSEADAVNSVPMPLSAQGAAFDTQGRLWVTSSGSKFGELMRIDTVSGAVQARYAMPAGLEDISFDADGGLWAMSEAGSQRWNTWPTFFPVVFRLDVAKLR